jgi:hypothetical protein
MGPTHATARAPHPCIAPMPREVGRAGVGHRTRNTLDARHRLAALARCLITLCKICEKTAMRRPCSSRRGRRGWRGRCWRRHPRNRERLEGAILVGTAIRYSLRWATTAAVLAVMATVPIGHFARMMAALASVLVACVFMALIVMLQWYHEHRTVSTHRFRVVDARAGGARPEQGAVLLGGAGADAHHHRGQQQQQRCQQLCSCSSAHHHLAAGPGRRSGPDLYDSGDNL